MTFLQPSVIHTSQPKEDSTLPERNTIAVPAIEILENNFQQALPAEALYDRSQSSNTVAPIQLVEPIVGLTPEEQCKKKRRS